MKDIRMLNYGPETKDKDHPDYGISGVRYWTPDQIVFSFLGEEYRAVIQGLQNRWRRFGEPGLTWDLVASNPFRNHSHKIKVTHLEKTMILEIEKASIYIGYPTKYSLSNYDPTNPHIEAYAHCRYKPSCLPALRMFLKGQCRLVMKGDWNQLPLPVDNMLEFPCKIQTLEPAVYQWFRLYDGVTDPYDDGRDVFELLSDLYVKKGIPHVQIENGIQLL